MDIHFDQLDRLLKVANEKEESFDFPVAFLTNVLYVCCKNKMTHLIDLKLYIDLMVKKADYMHLEGLAHAAHALDEARMYDDKAWSSIHAQIMKR